MALMIASTFTMAQNNALSNATSKPFVEKEMCDKVYDPADFPAPRKGGNTIGEALVIPSLPYLTSGTTSGYTNNYDEACPWSSTSPDVVYAFTPTEDLMVHIDLCGSSYDTKLYVYENFHTPGYPFACNDDYYGFGHPCGSWVSAISGLHFTAGNTYYMVIDGFGPASGAYVLDITGAPPVQCYFGAVVEEEPCGARLNDGCNMLPGIPVFEQVNYGDIFCGKTCTYGSGSRDTDWFELVLTKPKPFVLYAEADALMYFILLGPNDCSSMVALQQIKAKPGNPGEMDLGILPAGTYWFWAGLPVNSSYPEDVNYTMFFGKKQLPVIPVSNWALYLGILLMVTLVVIRFRRLV